MHCPTPTSKMTDGIQYVQGISISLLRHMSVFPTISAVTSPPHLAIYPTGRLSSIRAFLGHLLRLEASLELAYRLLL
jgi:hypothetical protein